MNDDESSSIDLEIDELVLNGFAAADRHAIGDAFQRELARLLAERGIPQAIAEARETAQLNIESFESATGSDAHAIGAELAKKIYGGFVK